MVEGDWIMSERISMAIGALLIAYTLVSLTQASYVDLPPEAELVE